MAAVPTKLELMSADDVASWLSSQGFSVEVTDSFIEQDMDGEAIMAMFAAAPGPDCLKDVLKKLGQRLKVYKAIKGLVEADADKELFESDNDGTRSPSQVSTIELSQVSSRPPTDQTSTSCKSVSPTTSRNYSCPSSGLDNHESPPNGNKNEVPNPFPIPRFRKCTQDKLDDNRLADGDRKYIVSTLGTVLLTYVEKASKKDCLIVAESLIRKYPFLKEPHSWQHFIYNKCQNINRRPSGSGVIPAKRPKLSNNNAHSYPGLEEGEDEESYHRNLTLLEKEIKKKSPSTDNLKDLMKRTFFERRRWIVGSAVSAEEIWTKFPLLTKSTFISGDFSYIMKRPGCGADFASDLLKWHTAINEYSLSTSNPSTGLRQALKDYPLEPPDDDEPVGNPHEWELLTAIRCLGYYLIVKKKGATTPEYDIPYILRIFQSGTPPADCIDTGNNLPYIVKICYPDYERPPQYFIALEQELIVECQKLYDSIFTLLAVHYVFNVVYHPRVKNFFLFLEEKVLALPSVQKGSKNAGYSSVVTGIESFLQD